MKTTTIIKQPNQDVTDIAITWYGTVAGLVLLMEDNPTLFTAAYNPNAPLVVRLDQADMTLFGIACFDRVVLAERQQKLAPAVATHSPFPALPIVLIHADFNEPRPILYPFGADWEITEFLELSPKVWGEKIDTISDCHTITVTEVATGLGIAALFEAPGAPWDAGMVPITNAGGPTYISAGLYEFTCILEVDLVDGSTVTYNYQSFFSV